VHHPKEAYAPAQFVGPLPYTAIQPRQDSQGVVVQTGEWYKVDPAPRSPFFLTEQQVTIAKVLVGTLSLAFLFYLLLTYTGVLAKLRRNPDVAELIAAIEQKIPKEARSLENLAEMAQMAFNSIDKYAKMNEE